MMMNYSHSPRQAVAKSCQHINYLDSLSGLLANSPASTCLLLLGSRVRAGVLRACEAMARLGVAPELFQRNPHVVPAHLVGSVRRQQRAPVPAHSVHGLPLHVGGEPSVVQGEGERRHLFGYTQAKRSDSCHHLHTVLNLSWEVRCVLELFKWLEEGGSHKHRVDSRVEERR